MYDKNSDLLKVGDEVSTKYGTKAIIVGESSYNTKVLIKYLRSKHTNWVYPKFLTLLVTNKGKKNSKSGGKTPFSFTKEHSYNLSFASGKSSLPTTVKVSLVKETKNNKKDIKIEVLAECGDKYTCTSTDIELIHEILKVVNQGTDAEKAKRLDDFTDFVENLRDEIDDLSY